MKSFRLDPDSIAEIIRTWPFWVLGVVIAAGIAVFDRDHAWGRFLFPVLGLCLVPSLLVGRMREKYPTARHLWLLSTGMLTLFIGVIYRMTFQVQKWSTFDLTWLGAAFVAILAFVLLNRGNKDVVG